MLAGSEPKGRRALLIVRAYEAFRAGEVSDMDGLLPGEAFDVYMFLPRLAPLLVRVADQTPKGGRRVATSSAGLPGCPGREQQLPRPDEIGLADRGPT